MWEVPGGRTVLKRWNVGEVAAAADRDCARRVSRSRVVRSGGGMMFQRVRNVRTLLRLGCETAVVRWQGRILIFDFEMVPFFAL